MNIGLLILIALLLFLIYLLCFPVYIKADTNKNKYYAGLPGIAGFRIFKTGKEWKIQYSILFLKFNIKPFETIQEEDDEPGKKKDNIKKSKNRPALFHIRLIKKIPAAFRIKRIIWNIDTGDYPLNAQLIPVASCFNNKKISISVNFNGNNSLYMLAQTRLILILYTIISLYMFNR